VHGNWMQCGSRILNEKGECALLLSCGRGIGCGRRNGVIVTLGVAIECKGKPQPNGKERLGSGNRVLSSGKRDKRTTNQPIALCSSKYDVFVCRTKELSGKAADKQRRPWGFHELFAQPASIGGCRKLGWLPNAEGTRGQFCQSHRRRNEGCRRQRERALAMSDAQSRY
jgi:hypothetical protein